MHLRFFVCVFSLPLSRGMWAGNEVKDVSEVGAEISQVSKAHSPSSAGKEFGEGSSQEAELKRSNAVRMALGPLRSDPSVHAQATNPTFDPPPPGPPHGSDSDPETLQDKAARERASKPTTMEEFIRDKSAFELPRYPPEDEWAFKTWWLEKWKPIGRKWEIIKRGFWSILAFPFHLLLSREGTFDPIPLHTLKSKPIGAWEKLPSSGKLSELKKTMKTSFNWLTSRIGLSSKNGVTKTPSESETESLLQKPTEPVEIRPTLWRSSIPKFPPVFSKDPLIKQQFEFGKLYHSGDNIEDLKLRVATSLEKSIKKNVELGHYTEKDGEILKNYLLSDEHFKLMEALYLKRIELAKKHLEVPLVLDQVVADLGGEKNTKEAFQHFLDYHAKFVHGSSHPDEIASRMNFKNRANFLRTKDPKAYEMHLSPLTVLKENLNQAQKMNTPEFKAASGYVKLKGIKRLDKLLESAEKAERYAELSKEVDLLQRKIFQLRDFASTIRRADFVDEARLRQRFQELFSFKEEVSELPMRRRTKRSYLINKAEV